MVNDENENDLLTFLNKSYTKNTANIIYDKIRNRLLNIGNYEMQSLRSLVYIAVRHSSFFEEVMGYDDPRDIIIQGEELSGGFGHWFKIPVNDIDEYIITVKSFQFGKDMEIGVKDENYWNEIEDEEKNRNIQGMYKQESEFNKNKIDLSSVRPKNIDPGFHNNELARKVWNLRRDSLYDFFKSLSKNKPQLEKCSELDNSIIKNLIDRICEKIHKNNNWGTDNIKNILPADIVRIIEQNYPQNDKELFEKIYSILEKTDLNISHQRLIRALLIHIDGNTSIWDEVLSLFSPEEIIVHIEYKDGIRIRNLNNPLDYEFVDDNETDAVKLLALELYNNSLPF